MGNRSRNQGHPEGALRATATTRGANTTPRRLRIVDQRRIRRHGILISFVLGFTIICYQFSQFQLLHKFLRRRRHYRVVVALSTTPSRLQYLSPTLESLIDRQHEPPDLVYLTLPEKQGYGKKKRHKYRLPDFIRAYVKQRKIMILKPEWDYGPITGVLYALEMESYDTRIIYVHDDAIYDQRLVSRLYRKAAEFEDAAVAFQGVVLKDYFRHIQHIDAHLDRNASLFVQTSGTPSFIGEVPIDIVQGLAGVCVQRRFFDIPSLKELVQELPEGVRKSEDFLLSAHLEWRNVTRMIVAGGSVPNIHPISSKIDRESALTHDNAVDAAYFLQQELGIWKNRKFLDRAKLAQQARERGD